MADWWSTSNVVAVLTAVLGVGTSVAAVWYERRPRRRQLGYRVQMAIRLGGGSRGGRGQAVFGQFTNLPGISDATLVLLRIENYGAQSISESDYTNNGPHGLTVDVADLTVRSVVVIPDPDELHLLGHFSAPDSLRYGDNLLQLPRVPLNPGQHYKLLILLSGGGAGSDLHVRGGIRDGGIVETESVSVDDKPQRFSRPARLIMVMLTACVVALAAIILIPGDGGRTRVGCVGGRLTIAGSTAFAPIARAAADRYQRDCPGATIVMDARGSEAGLRKLTAGREPRTDLIAFSDGRVQTGASPRLWGQAAALSVFALVVNNHLAVSNLTSGQIRALYTADPAGRITDWSRISPRDPVPVAALSRTGDSGTRQAFDALFLRGDAEPATSSPGGCLGDGAAGGQAVYCQLASSAEIAGRVAALPGAVGYVDLRAARNTPNVHPVSIDGHAPSIHDSGYRFTEIEYAYTDGRPVPGSLADAFLSYLITGPGRSDLTTDDDQPCYTPDNLPRCRG
ncbi:substrate-binding domain-containing protein [Frankia sp. Ag45/Mut15]|uniref:Substrate-binding domain-containing protein n=1 Tax=Frankia umida TaxID=573489 RepID=A0ABT0JYQ5_9ACTN|nr:substrate-binding domain-containing protein [Frankia umida]MCK9876677.1 substrate-binding domain-containing protein [Frankia umida]